MNYLKFILSTVFFFSALASGKDDEKKEPAIEYSAFVSQGNQMQMIRPSTAEKIWRIHDKRPEAKKLTPMPPETVVTISIFRFTPDRENEAAFIFFDKEGRIINKDAFSKEDTAWLEDHISEFVKYNRSQDPHRSPTPK